MSSKIPNAYEELLKGLWRENPVLVQVLGMCPVLAITNSVVNALVMGVSTMFVLIAANFFASALRRVIPHQVRISTYVVIIATFVTVVDFTLNATLPVVHKSLGAFIPLIVVNCIVLARQEAFASRHSVGIAILDAIGMGFGFTLALFLMGSIREILGNGTWFEISLFGPQFEPWIIMVLPPGGFLTLGLMLLFFRWIKLRRDNLVRKLDKMIEAN
jgi:electron transport complex protein RnfE